MFVGEGGKGWLPGGLYVTRVHTLRRFIPSLFPRKLFARWRGHAVNLLFFLDVNSFAYRWHNSRSFIFRCFIKWPIKYLSYSSHMYSWRLWHKCFMIGVNIEFFLTLLDALYMLSVWEICYQWSSTFWIRAEIFRHLARHNSFAHLEKDFCEIPRVFSRHILKYRFNPSSFYNYSERLFRTCMNLLRQYCFKVVRCSL